MVSRALGLAAGVLLMAAGWAAPVQAQENLDAGKSPSQLFGGNCSACHKSPRGLLKTVAPGSLPGFLRQHYTTGPEMAGVLSNYLISNGAGDVRYQGKGAKDGGKPETASDQPDRPSRRHRRSAAEPAEAGQAAPASDVAGTERHHGHTKREHGKPAGNDAAKPDGVSEDSAKPSEAPKESAPAPTQRAEPAPSAAPTTTQSIPSSDGADSK